MFPRIVVPVEACRFLDEFGIAYTEYEEGLYVADSIESVCRTCASAIGAGAKVFNLMSVEDVMIREESRVSGLVAPAAPPSEEVRGIQGVGGRAIGRA